MSAKISNLSELYPLMNNSIIHSQIKNTYLRGGNLKNKFMFIRKS